MEDLVESLTRGNVTEVKILLASIALALGAYQLALITIGYGKVRLKFLGAPAASQAHRAVGDAIALVLLIVGVMCVSVYGFDDESTFHVVAGSTLLAALALKIGVVRRGLGLSRFLPVLGISVFLLIAATWASSAGGVLADR
jgi:hypothetical protein